MDINAKGAKTYSRILNSLRVNNGASSHEHHKYDKHFKEWCEEKTPEEINRISGPKRKSTKQTDSANVLSKQKINKTIQKNKVLTAEVIVAPIAKTEKMMQEEKNIALKEKYRKMKWKKLVDGLKPGCRCDHVKSIGNGL